MYLYIAYIDGKTDVIEVKRFSDLSTHKSEFYYYEKPGDDWGKGTAVPKSEVLCIEVCSRLGTHDWEWKDESDLNHIFAQNTKASSASKDDDPFKKNDYRFCYSGG